MINLLENYATIPEESQSLEEDELISIIYRFASKKDEWFNLLLSLSNCISVSERLPHDHPYRDMSTRVMKHLKTAIKISAQLSNNEKPIEADCALNHIPMGAAIINEAGRVIEINELAEDYFNRSDCWQLDQGYLSASHLRLNAEFIPLCDDQHFSVVALPLESSPAKGETRGFRRESGSSKRRLIHMTSLPQSEDEAAFSKHFYLCFQTHDEDIIDAEALKSHYQLTDTEALVVATMISEVSSKRTASKLKLKDATIRGHLTNIYQKLGVTRKPELIRKVLLYKLGRPHHAGTAPAISSAKTENHYAHEFFYLKDGRRMSYFEHTKPAVISNKRATDPSNHQQEKPQVIVIFHNLMGSAMELPPGAEALLEKGNLRIIVPERPGYGDSDPHPERTHQDWIRDLEQLLDHLQIDSVKVLAHSIGGVYALAMAEYLPNRVERIAMVNAMTRVDDIMSCENIPSLVTAVNRSLRFAPFLIEPILKMAVGKDIEHFYSQQLNYIRPTVEGRAADINLLKTPQYRNYAVANLKQSAKQGISIWAEELKLSFADLAFKVKNKSTEYHFWHGEHDDVIPVEAAENLAKDLNARLFKRMNSETHFLFARHFNDVVTELLT